MDYEKAYRAALKTAKQWIKDECTDKEKICLESVFPELRESEDESIRKSIADCVSLMGEDDDVFSNHNVTKVQVLAWLKKQKEQKPVEPSDEELQRHQDELYDFKVFAARQAREHHISFVHDFEWNNFCAELLSYFHEQKSAEWSEEDSDKVALYLHDKYLHYTGFGMNWLKAIKMASEILDILRPSWKPSEDEPEYYQHFDPDC